MYVDNCHDSKKKQLQLGVSSLCSSRYNCKAVGFTMQALSNANIMPKDAHLLIQLEDDCLWPLGVVVVGGGGGWGGGGRLGYGVFLEEWGCLSMQMHCVSRNLVLH